VIVALLLCHATGEARADRTDQIPELSRTLTQSRSEKARISAAVSLGRLKDPRALDALVKALRDESNVVRSLAATALGHLGDERALPALRRATQDRDESVRQRATSAVARIRQGGKRGSQARAPTEPQKPPLRAVGRQAHYSIDAKESPRIKPRKPTLYVVVKSASDKSTGRIQPQVRKNRAQRMRSLVVEELQRSNRVTLEESEAQELGIPPYSIDVTLLKLDRRVSGPFIEIECEIRVAVSNGRGKMLSFLTGGAKVQVPARSFRKQYEPGLQREALENAVKSVHQDLITFLAATNPS
jgi:hypothetical protein